MEWVGLVPFWPPLYRQTLAQLVWGLGLQGCIAHKADCRDWFPAPLCWSEPLRGTTVMMQEVQ